MEGLYQVMVSSFRDIEPIFAIEVSMLKYPIFLVGSWRPECSGFIVHGGKSFGDDGIRRRRGGNLGGEGHI